MEYLIVDASREMLAQLENLEKTCFSVPWTREQLESQLPDRQHCFLVAYDGNKVLGYVGMMHVLDEGYISNVAVAPDVRRAGIGDNLIAELVRCAEDLNLSFVTLEVRKSNEAAIALYEKHGFRQVGLRKKYYDLPQEDAILMTKFLKKGI
jgi:ribosomal-protein-alanine N-acetyltransferase